MFPAVEFDFAVILNLTNIFLPFVRYDRNTAKRAVNLRIINSLVAYAAKNCIIEFIVKQSVISISANIVGCLF